MYIFYCCYGNNLFKLYELFKIEVSKTNQKWDWTICFPYNSPLVIKSQI